MGIEPPAGHGWAAVKQVAPIPSIVAVHDNDHGPRRYEDGPETDLPALVPGAIQLDFSESPTPDRRYVFVRLDRHGAAPNGWQARIARRHIPRVPYWRAPMMIKDRSMLLAAMSLEDRPDDILLVLVRPEMLIHCECEP